MSPGVETPRVPSLVPVVMFRGWKSSVCVAAGIVALHPRGEHHTVSLHLHIHLYGSALRQHQLTATSPLLAAPRKHLLRAAGEGRGHPSPPPTTHPSSCNPGPLSQCHRCSPVTWLRPQAPGPWGWITVQAAYRSGGDSVSALLLKGHFVCVFCGNICFLFVPRPLDTATECQMF